MDFVVGLILILTGIAVIKYRFMIYNFAGEWDWASKYVGGTTNAIVLFGMGLIFVGIAFPFGAFKGMNSMPSTSQTTQTQTGSTTSQSPFSTSQNSQNK